MTRPLGQSRGFARSLRRTSRGGFTAVISPLLRIVHVRPKQIPLSETLIFTSANGVAAFASLEPARDRVAYCVGDRSAEAAAAAGFRAVAAEGSANSLVRMVIDRAPVGPLLHVTGRHTRGRVAERLQEAGLKAVALAVYDQKPRRLSAEALAALHGSAPCVAPLFSPRSAELFLAQLHEHVPETGRLRLVCMSDAVAQIVAGGNFDAVEIIARPDAPAMLKSVRSMLGLDPAD
ncbi:uroporphyrinogen-III synthase [Brevirhabdus sp.]|uniref:uroporphyrinogen-III synthase n=1 Tax=Brevirhabdus sp. TaxID=2004514 RepID=UPI004057E60D